MTDIPDTKLLGMPRLTLCWLAGVAVAALLVQLCGCSLIGLGIGSIADANKPDRVTVEGWQTVQVKPGTQITVVLNDETQVSGIFTGGVRVTQEQYQQMYEGARLKDSSCAGLPALGDTLRILLKTHKQITGAFSNIDLCLVDWDWMPYLTINGLEEAEPQNISLNQIFWLRWGNEQKLAADDFELALAHSPLIIPFRALTISGGGVQRQIPVDSIRNATLPNAKHGATTGLLVGLAVDIAVILVTSSSVSRLSENTTSAQSCPFIYSFDGDDYHLDAEPFGGSISKGLQRTDWWNLDHLLEAEGEYRLKITNELPETQYVDEVHLLVIDHPRDVRVAPSSSDAVHTFSEPLPPSRGVDCRGANVLQSLCATDDDFWVSNPFGRNPQDKDEARDGVILDFPRPDGTVRAKLVLNAKNTLWAEYMLRKVVELQGREIDNWYQTLDTFPEVCDLFRQAMIREGMLSVQVWDGNQWSGTDFAWAPGAAVAKEQAVLLDIHDLPDSALKIKLESTVGFWMINSVHVSYSDELPSEITELSAIRVKDCHGNDLTADLEKSDGKYFRMPATHDWATLAFTAPPLRQGHDRSFVVKCSGYYTIHVEASGEPQKELIAKFLTEPGAFGQYSLELLNRQLAASLSGTLHNSQSNKP